MQPARPTALANGLDALAIGVSFACLVHCLALPLVIALLPAFTAWLDVPESFHLAMLAFALPFSFAVLGRSALVRRSFAPFGLGLAGLALMAGALLLGEGVAEALVSSIGATLLATGHVRNWRQRTRCRAHPD